MSTGRIRTISLVLATGAMLAFASSSYSTGPVSAPSARQDGPSVPQVPSMPSDVPATDDEAAPSDISIEHHGFGMGDADDTSLPAIYVLSMKGQMGTDIHPDIYARIVDEIQRENPDLVVWVMRCADIDERLVPLFDRAEAGVTLFDEFRELVQLLRDSPEMRNTRQVMWVHDAYGISAVVALSWDTVYMTPTARLGGLQFLWDRGERFGDEDIRAKMLHAGLGIATGFFQRAGRPIELARAMIDPSQRLSATWQGRHVIWTLDADGEYIINSSTKQAANFRARDAENFGVVTGVAETLDDLLLLEGFREYRLIDRSRAEQIINRYVQNWRRDYAATIKRYRDHQQHLGWASGDEERRWLGRAMEDIRYIIGAMNRYPAIELRWRMQSNANKLTLEIYLEQLQERMRSLRQGRGGGGGGGGGRGPGPQPR
jgi:hypothetical protein